MRRPKHPEEKTPKLALPEQYGEGDEKQKANEHTRLLVDSFVRKFEEAAQNGQVQKRDGTPYPMYDATGKNPSVGSAISGMGETIEVLIDMNYNEQVDRLNKLQNKDTNNDKVLNFMIHCVPYGSEDGIKWRDEWVNLLIKVLEILTEAERMEREK